MNARTDPGTRIAPARPAATLLLVTDDPFRVLMVERSANGAFPSALVFPGGTVDPDDHAGHWLAHLSGHDQFDSDARALRIAAWRETWEETGIGPPSTAASPLPPAKRRHLLNPMREAGSRIPLDALVRFGHWITPPTVPRRFDTHYFLAATDTALPPLCDGEEIVSSGWHEPAELIERANGGDHSLLFSTLANLHLLNESPSSAEALAAARSRHVVSVMPRREWQDGETWVSVPAKSGYGFHRMRFARLAGELEP